MRLISPSMYEPTVSGFHPLTLVTAQGIFRHSRNGYDYTEVHPETCKRMAAAIAATTASVCLDVSPFHFDKARRQFSVDQIAQVINIYRDANPDKRIGVLGLMPLRDYWAAVNVASGSPEHQSKYDDWLRTNLYLRTSGLSSLVDYVAPTLYASHPNVFEWTTFAHHTLQEAAKFRKPIFAWLWPRLVNISTYVGDDFFRQMIRLVSSFKNIEALVVNQALLVSLSTEWVRVLEQSFPQFNSDLLTFDSAWDSNVTEYDYLDDDTGFVSFEMPNVSQST